MKKIRAFLCRLFNTHKYQQVYQHIELGNFEVVLDFKRCMVCGHEIDFKGDCKLKEEITDVKKSKSRKK